MQTMHQSLVLEVLEATFCVLKLPPTLDMPSVVIQSSTFWTISKSESELSIVCDQALLPCLSEVQTRITVEKDWRAFRVSGTLNFSLTGILNKITMPLAEAGISLFAISTFDTDYILVKQEHFERVVSVLESAGHQFTSLLHVYKKGLQ